MHRACQRLDKVERRSTQWSPPEADDPAQACAKRSAVALRGYGVTGGAVHVPS